MGLKVLNNISKSVSVVGGGGDRYEEGTPCIAGKYYYDDEDNRYKCIKDTDGTIPLTDITYFEPVTIDDELQILMSERVVVLTSSLAAGETSVTFTNNAITPDSIIDINVDTEGVYLENREVSGNTLTITFSEHSATLGVKVVIRSFHI